jgi:hypothetical protein
LDFHDFLYRFGLVGEPFVALPGRIASTVPACVKGGKTTASAVNKAFPEAADAIWVTFCHDFSAELYGGTRYTARLVAHMSVSARRIRVLLAKALFGTHGGERRWLLLMPSALAGQ